MGWMCSSYLVWENAGGEIVYILYLYNGEEKSAISGSSKESIASREAGNVLLELQCLGFSQGCNKPLLVTLATCGPLGALRAHEGRQHLHSLIRICGSAGLSFLTHSAFPEKLGSCLEEPNGNGKS